MENIDPDVLSIIIKIVIVGESSVGKTNLLLRYMKNSFDDSEKPTIGMDFFTTEITKENTTMKIQFWDTAGQEKYKSLASAYYKVSNGVILVYDVTNRNSFDRLRDWIKEIKMNVSSNTKIILIGNKTDLADQRQVTSDEGTEFAKNNEMFFWETSAKVNREEFVQKAFEEIIEECRKNILAYEEIDMKNQMDEIRTKAPTIRSRRTSKAKSECC